MCRHRTAYLAPLLGLLLVLLPALAGADEPFKCTTCHRTLAQGEVVHKPVAAAACLKCHQQLSYNHPLGGKGTIGFIVPKEKLCVHCHTKLLTKKSLHPPVAQGNCVGCHRPHNSPNKSLLKDPPPTLCFGCHPKEKFTAAAHAHPPVQRGECLSCHDPHQADGPKLLRKQGSDLCFSCHDQKLARGKSVHPPVAQGNCVGCHAVHGSPNRKILKADFSEEFYLPFRSDVYPLCFTCHNPELVSTVQTDSATNFRNGTRNLHAVHVGKKGKGRSCRICHNPHASSQDRLINPKAPGFGTWAIPILYTKTATGGGCSVGCHKPLRYDRVTPVVQ